MIKLENVSALDLWRKKENEFLKENNILNYQELKDYIGDDYKGDLLPLYLELLEVQKRVNKFNVKGKEPVLYFTEGYSWDELEKNDKTVFGNELLLWNPTTELWINYAPIKRLNMFEIKHLLSHTDSSGDNKLCQLRGIGEGNIKAIVDAVSMYERQIERQAIDAKVIDDELFYLNQNVKKELVMDSLKDIVLYLLDKTEKELVWGEFSDWQKKRLISAVVNDKKIDRVIRGHLCDVITNYTTLSELESGITKGKTLNRFIKK